MYFAGYPQFNQSMPQMSMPVNASNQQGSSVEGANTGMLGSMFGMGLGGFGGGFSPSGFSMPQIDYSGGMGGPKYLPGDRSGGGGFGGGFGGMVGYGGFGMPQIGFGGFGMPQMGYGGFGGGFGMPQMGYGGYGGFGGFGMPQMGFGLGSFGPQMGFGGYGNYGGFQPPQYGTTDYKSPYLQDLINRQVPQPAVPPPPQNTGTSRSQVMPSEPIPDPGDGMFYTQALIPATVGGVEGYYTDGSRRNFVPYDKSQSGGAYIPDETGQYDPNRGNYGQVLAPTYSEPSAPVAEPLSVAGPPKVTQEIIGTPIPVNSAPINQPRRMRNSMNMGIGSFFGGIGPGNFRNFYTP